MLSNIRTTFVRAVLISGFVSLFIAPKVLASYPFNISKAFSIKALPPIGSLIAEDQNGFRLTSVPYDTHMVGVVVPSSDMVFVYDAPQEGVYDERFLIESGEADILVNETGGTIKKGDFITSSSIKGEGMRATEDGLIIGIALENYTPVKNTRSGLVHGLIQPRFTTSEKSFTAAEIVSKYGLFGNVSKPIQNFFKLAPDKLAKTPSYIRYLLALLIIIIAIIFGFYLFARIALRGLESLGRNPLARWSIITGIILNTAFTIVLISIAVIFAYLIITV